MLKISLNYGQFKFSFTRILYASFISTQKVFLNFKVDVLSLNILYGIGLRSNVSLFHPLNIGQSMVKI